MTNNEQIIKECSYKGECQMMGCFNDDNCFIKQLFEERNRAESEYYRKEQECEKAKQNAQDTYDLWQALIESFNILQDEKIKLETKLDQLQKENNTLFKAIEEVNKINKRLETENEELKEQLTILDDEDLVAEITVKQFEEYKKLKQTLEEIREIVYQDCNECGSYDDGIGQTYEKCDDCKYGEILQKINECEMNDERI